MQPPRLISSLFLCTVLLAAGAAPAATFEVAQGDSIAVAVRAAADGDTILIAPGVYVQWNIVLDKDLVVGGAGPDAGAVELRTWGLAPVFLCEDLTAGAEIRNLTMVGVYDDNYPTIPRGGGLLLTRSSPQIANCRFEDLRAAHGGALFCREGSAPIVSACTFESNTALVAGGAVACVDGAAPALIQCLFVGNQAGASGGAIHAARSSQPRIFASTFVWSGSPQGYLSAWDGSAFEVHNTIVSITDGADAWSGDAASVPVLSCTDIYSTGYGWPPPYDDQLGRDGNVSGYPQFCYPQDGVSAWALQASSPCAAENSGCGLMGALPVACGASATPPEGLPAATRVVGNRPNPFNPATIISFDLRAAGSARMDVHDLAGRRVRTLLDEPLAAGRHEIAWDGRDAAGRPVAAGIYFYRLRSGGHDSIGRMALIK